MTDQPERPTCRTCPYWESESFDEDGECRRFPPAKPSTDEQQKESDAVRGKAFGMFKGWFPMTSDSAWCGEHPRFGDYLAATRNGRMTDKATAASLHGEPPKLPGVVVLNWDFWREPRTGSRAWVACRKLGAILASDFAKIPVDRIKELPNVGQGTLEYMVAKLKSVGVEIGSAVLAA